MFIGMLKTNVKVLWSVAIAVALVVLLEKNGTNMPNDFEAQLMIALMVSTINTIVLSAGCLLEKLWMRLS